MNPLNSTQIEWIKAREGFFTKANRGLSSLEAAELWAIYNWVTGKNQKPSGCGRCAATAKNTVWAQYKKQIQDDDK